MRVCPVCHSQVSDESYYCTMCGNRLPDDPQPVQSLPQGASNPYQNPYQQPVYRQPIFNPYDHTAEFDIQDVAQHKLYAMLMYLTGLVGILFALLGARESAYVQFHLRQNLKFVIVELVLGLLAAGTFFTVIIPILLGICLLIVEVIHLIAFVQTARGKSKEPAIIRSLGFLK